jgi:hypothetical protein
VHKIQQTLENFNGRIRSLQRRNHLYYSFYPKESLVGPSQHKAAVLPYWRGSSIHPSKLGKGDKIPFEVQPPVEAAPHDRRRTVGKCVSANDVNHWAHHSVWVLTDGGQQGLQPHHVHFAVAVQKYQDFP